jgi:hypothetical protein
MHNLPAYGLRTHGSNNRFMRTETGVNTNKTLAYYVIRHVMNVEGWSEKCIACQNFVIFYDELLHGSGLEANASAVFYAKYAVRLIPRIGPRFPGQLRLESKLYSYICIKKTQQTLAADLLRSVAEVRNFAVPPS